jgi:hypothetical protein
LKLDRSVHENKNRLKFLPDTLIHELKTAKFINDRLRAEEWKPTEGLGELFLDLIEALGNHNIVAYHNTRLTQPEDIYHEGLIFSDERYLGKLKRAILEAGMDENIAVELERLVKKEQAFRQENFQNRINEVSFFYDMDYYLDYDIFLMTLGGEFVDNALRDKNQNRLITADIAARIKKLGMPCVVEFFFPGKWLESILFDVARYMIEKWVCDDLRNEKGDHRYDDRIETEIPASNIIKVHVVKEPARFEDN